MNKIIFFLCFIFATLILNASPVDSKTAKNIAQNFWVSNGGESNLEWTDITSRTSFTEFYIWSNSHGFVIVSGDNCVVPILGYSLSNAFNPKMPAHIADYLKGIRQEIAYYKSLPQSNRELSALWASLIHGNYTPQSTASVSPLLTTTWDQIEIYDMAGRLIAFEAANDNGTHTFTMNASGLYLVRVGETISRKVMIIK